MDDPETNVYSFGVLALEIISGRLAYSEEKGPIEKWVRKVNLIISASIAEWCI